MREEYEDDKFAKSAVETVRSRLAWWRKRAREHKVSPYPVTMEHLKLMGSLLKKGGYRSAGAYLSAVKNQHIRLGHPWSDALDLELREANVRVREALGLPGSVVLSTCRSWRTWPLGATLCVREDPYFHVRARCVALGGQCEKLNCPRLGACKSLSSEVKVVGAASSICPSPKLTRKPLARSEPMRVLVLPLLMQVVGLCVQSRWPGSCTMVHFIIVLMVHTQFQR